MRQVRRPAVLSGLGEQPALPVLQHGRAPGLKAAILRQYRFALIAVGLIACIGGIRGMSTGEVLGGRYGVQYRERFTGVSARLIGAVLLLAGLPVMVLSAIDLYTLGGVRDWLSALAGSLTGLALVLGLAGLMLCASGIARILSGSAKLQGRFSPLVELGFRASGVVSVLTGLAMLSIAAGLILAPALMVGLYDQAVRAAKGLVLNQ